MPLPPDGLRPCVDEGATRATDFATGAGSVLGGDTRKDGGNDAGSGAGTKGAAVGAFIVDTSSGLLSAIAHWLKTRRSSAEKYVLEEESWQTWVSF